MDPETSVFVGNCLAVQSVSKSFGSNRALNCFSYSFSNGIYGIMGANGAGKSTLFNILTNLIPADQGRVLWNSQPIGQLGKKYRQILGYMPQGQSFYPDLSVREFLMYMASLKGLKRSESRNEVNRLLLDLELDDFAYKKMKTLSGGMRQRTLLAQALLGDPRILILDEPTAGVDPQERIRIRSYIASLSKDRIVLLATHIVSDIECIANQVILMKKGVIQGIGTPQELIHSIQGKTAEKRIVPEEIEFYQQQYGMGILSQKEDGQYLKLIGDELPEEFLKNNDGNGLEEVYLYYCRE